LTGTLFLKRFNNAFKLSAKQTEVFNQFSATFALATIKKWEAMITAWEANPKAPNPYEEPESGKESLGTIHLWLSLIIVIISDNPPGCSSYRRERRSGSGWPWKTSTAQDELIGILNCRL
jgi:hypothetical protein